MKILFVENHPLFAKTVIEEFLAAHDVVVIPTVAASKAIDASTFDVALVDYDLPADVACPKRDFRQVTSFL